MLDKDYYAAVSDYNSAVLHGIVKIASKMGISTIQSYQGSQIFEAIGISKEVIDTYFTNTVSRIGGITLKDIERDMNTWHMRAFDPLGLDVDLSLDSIGGHKMRSGKEEHLYKQELSICFRNPQNAEIMRCLKSILIILMKKHA